MSRLNIRLLSPLMVLALGSCSYVYDLQAVVIDGRLAFIVDPSSRRQPDCVRSIYVDADYGEPKAEPIEGDDVGLVVNGSVYWWDFREVSSCDNPFPIFYGDELKGKRSENVGYVAPKPLIADVVYQVAAESRGSGYGSVWFKIRLDGQVENYPIDPTPPIRDADGYVISEEAN